ncbi:MAG: D-glycero-beta-D-manno-heptose 1-phosphate adenylyltransferase [bacterium]|nr:D-glycero-beta-D-manno-heptose 1-phosphate adenylyltransferase [bacterium]
MSKDKVKSLSALKEIIDSFKKQGKKIGFTNGCFDLIHVGHIKYLRAAKKLCDILIVAINSDKSVKGLKGNKRPLFPQDERAEILSAFEFVDYVVIFDEPDPDKTISALLPDILVKGGDYKIDQIIGRNTVTSHGGKVITIPEVKGKSTSEIIKKIK